MSPNDPKRPPNLANGHPILGYVHTSGSDDVYIIKRSPAEAGLVERIYLRTFRLPADSLPLSEIIS